MNPEEKILQSYGSPLPEAPKAIASYVPAVQSGELIFVSGQLPLKDGKIAFTGKLGQNVSMEVAGQAARICTVNALSIIKSIIGDLGKIKRIVKIGVYVAGTSDFVNQHLVANFASNFLEEIFNEKGKHARFAVGVCSLPLDSPVEIEFTVEI